MFSKMHIQSVCAFIISMIQHDDLKKFIIDRYQNYIKYATFMLKELSSGVRTKNNDFKVSKGF